MNQRARCEHTNRGSQAAQLEAALHVLECYHLHTGDEISRFRNDENGVDIIVVSDPVQRQRLRHFLRDRFKP